MSHQHLTSAVATLLHVEHSNETLANNIDLPSIRRRERPSKIEGRAEELTSTAGINVLHVEHLRPNQAQPRRNFPEEELTELAASIRQHGLLQPIAVRKVLSSGDIQYEIIAGERRWRAVKTLGLETIEARVLEADDLYSATLALIENTHRSDLTIVELANAYQSLIEEHGWTQKQLAEHVASTRQQVGHVLSVLKLPDAVAAQLAAGVLSLGHAKVLLSIDNPQTLEVLAKACVSEGLSVRSLEERVALLPAEDTANGKAGPVKAKRKSQQSRGSTWSEWTSRIEELLDTKAQIKGSRGNYTLAIRFSDVEDLERLVSQWGSGDEPSSLGRSA